MDTIKNYLETMFANLPNTVEVKKAKDELYSMMEDKYTELINEGKTENEAVGTVISEFGNLDELAESLGIDKVVSEAVDSDTRVLCQEEVLDYIRDVTRQRFTIGLGVMLCCFAMVGPILFATIGDMIGREGVVGIGVILMFLLAAAGVGMFIFSSVMMSQWKFLQKEPCAIDFSTAEYLAREKEDNAILRGSILTIGIIICVLSIIPVIAFSTIFGETFPFLTEGIGPSMIFICAGVGVLLIIFSGAKDTAYDKLLSLNDVKTMAGDFEPVKKARKNYVNDYAKDFMSMYWKIVLCIYLIISFSSFNWGSSWLIWPIAGIIRKPLGRILTGNREGGEAK